MSCRLPCVVSDVGDVSCLLREGAGILLEHNDPKILTDYWLSLISGGRNLWMEIGEKARARICDQYDIQRSLDSYIKVYGALYR